MFSRNRLRCSYTLFRCPTPLLSIAFVAHTTHIGTSFFGITHFNSLGPWVLYLGATDQITVNKSFFSSICTSDYLRSITMANDSRVSSYGVGIIHLLPLLSIDNVLYVSRSPFNLLSISHLTRSLDCVIYFTKDFVCLQDRSSGRIIGTEYESHGLYHLRTSVHVDMVMNSQSLLHAQLARPSLTKMQQLVSSLSKLSNLSCESCHLGKQIRSSFPSSVVQQFGMTRSEVDHSIFYHHSSVGSIYLVIYIDDIVHTGSDNHDISQIKHIFVTTFKPKILANSDIFWELR